MTTFFVPCFDKNIPNKTNAFIDVFANSTLVAKVSCWISAIASNGIPAQKDGVYVFVTNIEKIGNSGIFVGFASVPTFDSSALGHLGLDFPGIALNLYSGKRWPDGVP